LHNSIRGEADSAALLAAHGSQSSGAKMADEAARSLLKSSLELSIGRLGGGEASERPSGPIVVPS